MSSKKTSRVGPLFFSLATLLFTPGCAESFEDEVATKHQTSVPLSNKKGLLFGGGDVRLLSDSQLNTLLNRSGLDNPQSDWGSKWFYTFNISPEQRILNWAAENGMNFVMQQSARKVQYNDAGATCKLYSSEEDTPEVPSGEICTYGQWKTALVRTLDAVDLANTTTTVGMPQVKYLMGFNEPYNDSSPSLSPQAAMKLWKKYFTPLRNESDSRLAHLKLISPNAKVNKPNHVPGDCEGHDCDYNPFDWLVEFIGRCSWGTGDGCKPDLDIKKIALHNYDCSSEYMHRYFGAENSFKSTLRTQLEAQYPNPNFADPNMTWATWVSSRKIWITEHTCNWPSNSYGSVSSNKESCETATGNRAGYNDEGSLMAMEELSRIERYFWFTTYRHNSDLSTEMVNGNPSTQTRNKWSRLLTGDIDPDTGEITVGGHLTKTGQAYRFFQNPAALPTICESF